MPAKYRIRFTKAQKVEQAPPEGKGGYVVKHIPLGTEMEVNDASLAFWQARNSIELLGRVEETRSVSPFGQQPYQPQPPAKEEATPFTKTALKPVLDALLASFDKGEQAALIAGLAALQLPLIENALVDLPQDQKMLLETAITDAGNGALLVNTIELRDVLLDALDVLLPPSRRTRVKA